MVLDGRIGGAPISWGVCEVPGWGAWLPAERVLSEMRELGITATELGAAGFLPSDPAALRELLERHRIGLIGGFVPAVLHDPERRPETLAEGRRVAELFAAAGAGVAVTAAVVDAEWSAPFDLAGGQWDELAATLAALDAIYAAAGITHAVHPHAGTLVETRRQLELLLDRTDAKLCLDTGHLMLGGADPVAVVERAAERVAHVHLKDVRGAVLRRVRAGELDVHAAIKAGLFCPLGQGDAPIAEVVVGLERAGYRGWYVLEQDVDLGAAPPPAGTGPRVDVAQSLGFLAGVVAGELAGSPTGGASRPATSPQGEA